MKSLFQVALKYAIARKMKATQQVWAKLKRKKKVAKPSGNLD
jgi:hypothetical protein